MAVSGPHSLQPEIQSRIGKSVGVARRHGATNVLAIGALFAVMILTVLIPILAPHSPTLATGESLSPPSSEFPLGTDHVGRDLLSRVLFGLRSTWWAAMGIVVMAVIIGSLIGLAAGVLGGWIDGVLMRLTDTTLAVPGTVLAIAVVAALGPSLIHTMLALTIVWWTPYARVVRGQVVAIMARPHIEAARMAGSGTLRLARRHVLPGVIPPVVVTASLDIGVTILALAALSFLGLGSPAPAPELGAMVETGLPYLLEQWWVPIMPGLGIFLVTFIANFAGDSIRDLMPER